jgi:hypothetical protein
MSRPSGEPTGGAEDSYTPAGDRDSLENFELNFHILSTARQLTEACDELELAAKKYANAHRDFKRERAKALLASAHKTVSEREAQADIVVDEERFQNYLTEGLMQASLERVRSLRGILSAFQTLANKQKEEMAFGRTGPN